MNFPYKRQGLAAGLLIAVGVTSGMASADISVYGRAHMSVDSLNDGDDSAVNVSSNSSRIGFRAGHDVTDNLRAIAQIEQEVRYDTSGTEFATRDSFAGIEGDWGLLRVGKFDTPLKRVRSAVDFFGDQVGDARNIVRNRAVNTDTVIGEDEDGDPINPPAIGFDERFNNSIHYRSPAFGPVTLDVQYSTNLSGSSTNDNSDNDATSASVTWREGPLFVVLAHETSSELVGDRSASRLGAGFDINNFRIAGMYQSAEDPDDNAYGVGVRYRLGKNDFKAQYYVLDADADDADASMVALGVDHHVTGDFRFYAVAASMSNDDESALTPYSQARSAGPVGVAGETSTAFSVGFRYDF